ncbi:MAG: tetratricopeptide repeat protein, partial [Chitinophagales bacterium]
MSIKVKAGITVIFICIAQIGFAQKEFLKMADKLYNAGAYSEAAPMYLALLQQTYNYEQNKKLAYCYLQLNMVNDAEHWYGVLANQNAGEPDIILNYAQILKLNGKYKTAKEWFLEYAKYNDDGYYLAGTCDFAAVLIQQPQYWALDTLSINSKGSDIAPAFYRSGIIYASTGVVTGDKKQKVNKSAGLPFYDL